MKSSFNFKIANVSVSDKIVIGEFSVNAEVEFTQDEYLRLTEMSGEFYTWLATKVDPIIEAGIPMIVASMQQPVKAQRDAGFDEISF